MYRRLDGALKRNRLPQDNAGDLVHDGLGVGIAGNLQPTILHAFLFDAVVGKHPLMNQREP